MLDDSRVFDILMQRVREFNSVGNGLRTHSEKGGIIGLLRVCRCVGRRVEDENMDAECVVTLVSELLAFWIVWSFLVTPGRAMGTSHSTWRIRN